MQSTLRRAGSGEPRLHIAPDEPEALHVAIILDGNGRWARRRRLPRSAGHRAGARAVKRTVEAAGDQGIDILTLFAFSADNWHRPPAEVASLMTLFGRYLATETRRCVDNGVRLNIIGRRDRLEPRLVEAIDKAEAATAAGRRLLLRVAVDYSARRTISKAASLLAAEAAESGDSEIGVAAFERALARACHSVADVPAVDLLIRTSGEQRLSDFLLWESAYAELLFTPTLWPDFGADDLSTALAGFRRRERRFGRVAVPAAAPSASPRLAGKSA